MQTALFVSLRTITHTLHSLSTDTLHLKQTNSTSGRYDEAIRIKINNEHTHTHTVQLSLQRVKVIKA